MTFAINKTLSSSKKILLFELDIPAKNGTLDYLLSYEPGIWQCTLAPGVVEVEDDYGVTCYYSNQLVDDGNDVGSVVVFGVAYSKLYSLDELRFQTEAFYYDSTTTKIYISFKDHDKPFNYNYVDYISLGLTTGFCNQAQTETGVYYDDVEYKPLLTKVPTITKQKDPLFFGLISFSGGSVSLDNTGGYFDNFKNLNIYNQPCRLKLGFEGDELSDFRTVYTGFFESYTWSWDDFTIKMNDPRKKLTTPLPKNKFNKTDYTDLADDDVDKPKPICYGTVRNAPLKCVNDGNDAAATYYFYLSDTEYYDIDSVSKVYLSGVDLGSGQWTADLTTGIVSIAATTYVTKDNNITIGENRGEITADFTGVPIKNALAVIKDILDNYGSIEFTPTYFNTAEYNFAQAYAPDVCIYLDEEKTIKDVIELCCVASDASFIVQDDGLFTARNYSATRTPNRTINTDEWIAPPEISIDESKFLSSVTIKYNKNADSDNWQTYYNDDYQTEVAQRYKGFKTKQIETVLSTLTGATAKSIKVMELSKNVPEVVKRKTKIQNIDTEIMDFVICSPVSRIGENERFGIYEVIGINKNLTNFEVDLNLRFVSAYTPPADAITYDGILWNHYLWGHKLFTVAGVL